MGRMIFAALSALVFLSAGCGEKRPYEVKPKDGAFSITFPCDPVPRTTNQDLGNGRTMKNTTWVCSTGRNVRFSLYRGSITDPTDSGFLYSLAAARKNITGAGGEIVSEHELKVQGRDGRRFEVKSPGAASTLWVVVRELDVYVLEVSRPLDKRMEKEAEAFYASFKLR